MAQPTKRFKQYDENTSPASTDVVLIDIADGAYNYASLSNLFNNVTPIIDSLQVDTITEKTTNAGVTIEGVKFEDGDVETTGDIIQTVSSGTAVIAQRVDVGQYGYFRFINDTNSNEITFRHTPASSIFQLDTYDGSSIRPVWYTKYGEDKFYLRYGAGVNEFSTDTTLSGDSDLAVPTEKAVKTYVDNVTYSTLKKYVVNSANRSSGIPDIINKVSDSSINFKVDSGGTYEPVVATFADGKKYELTSIPTIAGISGDGTYIVYLKESAGSITSHAEIITVTEDYVSPTSPNSGDKWLDISAEQYKSYNYNGSGWDEENIVKIGQFIVSGGTLGSIINYALNGMSYVNVGTVGINYSVTPSHNLGINPIYIKISGYFSNITGSGATSVIPNGSSGYFIGNSIYNAPASISYGSVTYNTTQNNTTIRGGSAGIWHGSTIGSHFSGGDLFVIAKRDF